MSNVLLIPFIDEYIREWLEPFTAVKQMTASKDYRSDTFNNTIKRLVTSIYESFGVRVCLSYSYDHITWLYHITVEYLPANPQEVQEPLFTSRFKM